MSVWLVDREQWIEEYLRLNPTDSYADAEYEWYDMMSELSVETGKDSRV